MDVQTETTLELSRLYREAVEAVRRRMSEQQTGEAFKED